MLHDVLAEGGPFEQLHDEVLTAILQSPKAEDVDDVAMIDPVDSSFRTFRPIPI